MKRKRWLFLFALLPVFALLCGCSSLYTNYKDIEMLQVIQTLGIDRGENGGVVLSVASGANVKLLFLDWVTNSASKLSTRSDGKAIFVSGSSSFNLASSCFNSP